MKEINLKLTLTDKLISPLKNTVSQASQHLKKLQNQMDGMKRESNQSFSGIGSSIKLNGSQVTTALSSLSVGVGVVGAGLIGAITKLTQSATEAQKGTLGAAAASSALLNLPYKDALKLQQEVTREMAKSAVLLPGSTQNYTDTVNGLADTLAIIKDFTKSGLTDRGKRLIENTTLLGIDNRLGSQPTSSVMGKLLGDDPEMKLFAHNVFENVPAFKAELEKESKKLGMSLEQFLNADIATRTSLVDEALSNIYSEEYKKTLANTFQGQIESLKGSLFDPFSGLFGFYREIDYAGIKTTALDQMGKLTKDLGNFFNALGNLTQSFGIKVEDPIRFFIQGMDSFSGWVKKQTEWINLLMDYQANLSDRQIGDAVGSALSVFLGNLLKPLADPNITNYMWQGLIHLFNGVGAAINRMDQDFTAWFFSEFPNWWQGFLENTRKEFAALDTIGADQFKAINDTLNSWANNLQSSITAIGTALSDLFSRVISTLQNLDPRNWVRNFGGNSANVSVGNGYAGNHLEWLNASSGLNLNGLFGAVNREVQNMPQGAKPVIANSSELIIPRSKIPQLLPAQPQYSFQFQITQNKVEQIVDDFRSALIQTLQPVSMI